MVLLAIRSTLPVKNFSDKGGSLDCSISASAQEDSGVDSSFLGSSLRSFRSSVRRLRPPLNFAPPVTDSLVAVNTTIPKICSLSNQLFRHRLSEYVTLSNRNITQIGNCLGSLALVTGTLHICVALTHIRSIQPDRPVYKPCERFNHVLKLLSGICEATLGVLSISALIMGSFTGLMPTLSMGAMTGMFIFSKWSNLIEAYQEWHRTRRVDKGRTIWHMILEKIRDNITLTNGIYALLGVCVLSVLREHLSIDKIIILVQLVMSIYFMYSYGSTIKSTLEKDQPLYEKDMQATLATSFIMAAVLVKYGLTTIANGHHIAVVLGAVSLIGVNLYTCIRMLEHRENHKP